MKGSFKIVSAAALRATRTPRARIVATKMPRPESHLEASLVQQIKLAGLPAPEREFRFAAPRRFRFDLCWKAKLVAVECEGATWIWGRHVRGAGFEKDLEKTNLAQLMGWRVFRFTKRMIDEGDAIVVLTAVLK